MDAGAIAHHGKEDGGGYEEEAERTKHDPVQGMRENLDINISIPFGNIRLS